MIIIQRTDHPIPDLGAVSSGVTTGGAVEFQERFLSLKKVPKFFRKV